MNALMDNNYIKKIIDHKQLLISELTDEFGSQYKELLSERFDKIKFIFFVSPQNFRTYLINKYSYLAAHKIVEFIKKEGILSDVYVNNKFKDMCGYIIEPKDESENLFNDIFGQYFLDFDFEKKYTYKTIFGIYSFDASQDFNELSSYAKHRNITPEEFVKNNRCDFLRKTGKYPRDYSNEMICSDIKYSKWCTYYEELMEKYNAIIKDVQEQLKDEIELFNKLENTRKKIFINNYKKILEELIEYLSDEDKEKVTSVNYDLKEIRFLSLFFCAGQDINEESELETLTEEERQRALLEYYGIGNEKMDVVEKLRDARKRAAERHNKQILETFTFETNCDISNVEVDRDLSLVYSTLCSTFIQDDGIEKHRLILFDPYTCDEEYLDIHLRHELRHSLTSSVRKENGLDIVKVGNAEYVYEGENLVVVNNELYNELVTQRRALDNTKTSFENGIYILSPQGATFPNGITSGYDEYLPEFNKVFTQFSPIAIVSQVEATNNNLYKFISQNDIKRLEDGLYSFNGIPLDILESILIGTRIKK